MIKKEHIYYFDYLKVIASLMVIMIHASAPPLIRYLPGGNALFISDLNFVTFFRVISDSAVPLFFMINGALLLNKKYDFRFKKSFLRVFYPLIIWSIIGVLVASFYSPSFDFKANLLKILGVSIPYNLTKKLYNIYNAYHFWYIYTLLSIYLIISPLKKMVVNLAQKDYLYLITIWLIFQLVIPLLSYYFKITTVYKPYLFTDFLGFYLLGYYLNNTIVNKNNKPKNTLFLLFIIAVSIPWILTWYSNLHAKKLDTFFITNLTPIHATILFVIAKITFTKPNKIMSCLSKLSFAAYCCHAIVFDTIRNWAVTKDFISYLHDISSSLEVIILFGLVAIISYFIAWLISLLPKKISAYFGV